MIHLIAVLFSLLVPILSETIEVSDELTCQEEDFSNKEYRNDYYVGEMKNYKPHGKGTLYRSDKSRFDGNFVYGFEEGEGIRKYKDGSLLNAIYSKGEIRVGKLILSQGEMYEGQFSGNGKDGDFKFNGKGKYYHQDGTVYQGQFREGIKHGRGVLKYKSGGEVQGEWVYGNLMEAEGELIYEQGSRYVGSLFGSKREGKGIYYFGDEGTYTGNWENDMFEGFGILKTKKNGTFEVFKGYFHKGEKKGKGKYTFANGDIYIGEFDNDDFHGNGVVHYLEGFRYEGIWRNGLRDGVGMVYLPDGKSYEFEFDNGKYVRGDIQSTKGMTE